MNGVDVVVVGVLVLIAAVAGLCLQARFEAARIEDLKVKQGVAFAKALRLSGRISELEAEIASLRSRNEMLVGLVGADAERAALAGACADEAGWGA